MKLKLKQKLLICDNREENPDCEEYNVLWQSYTISDPQKEVSIPQLVEDNADQLRTEYLKLIYDLGEKRIIDRLEIRPGFSYWWMTRLAEKCNYPNSPQIDNIIKLIAFKKWFENKEFSSIRLVSSNIELVNALRLFANQNGVDFNSKIICAENKDIGLFRKFFDYLPNIIRNIVWLLYYFISRLSLIGVGVSEWKKTPASMTFISYLDNLVPESLTINRFDSLYWTELPRIIEHKKIPSNWLHMFVKNKLTPNARSARDVVNRFNTGNKQKQTHATLDSFLSVTIVLRTILDYLRLRKKSFLLNSHLKECSNIYWPLLENDSIQSILGVQAISNLLTMNLLYAAFGVLPYQVKGVYLLENQPWEKSLINAWRTSGHGNLTGAPHSSIVFWNMKLYFDCRIFDHIGRNHMPMPDKVALNGPMARKLYLGGKYPESQLFDVEALRYLHLIIGDFFAVKKVDKKAPLKVLIIGDYDP